MALSSEGFLIDSELYARAARQRLREAAAAGGPLAARRRPLDGAAGDGWKTLVQLARLARTLRAEAGRGERDWPPGDGPAGGPRGRAAAVQSQSSGARAVNPSVERPAAGLAVAGVVLALALAFQGTRGIWEPDEGRNVNIASGYCWRAATVGAVPQRDALSL